MARLNAFWSDERAAAPTSWLILSAFIALACLGVTHALDYASQNGALASLVRGRPSERTVVSSAPALNQATVDFTPIGSIPANLAAPSSRVGAKPAHD